MNTAKCSTCCQDYDPEDAAAATYHTEPVNCGQKSCRCVGRPACYPCGSSFCFCAEH